jgi:hypothetical protein
VRFASRFFRIFRLALEASDDERRWPDWPSVSRELNSLLAAEGRIPLPPGFGPAERREALWPVLVWIDETFLNSRRRDAAGWYDYSLQRQLLDTNVGGELFYRRLKALLELRRRHLPGGPGGALSASRLESELAAGRLGAASPAAPAGAGNHAAPGGQPDSAAGPEAPGPGSGPGDAGDGGRDGVEDYLPDYFYMEEIPDSREEEVTASDLNLLWESPGDGPEPLESVLDTYAMCIILGFKGQFSPKGRGAASKPDGGGTDGRRELGSGRLEDLLGGPASTGPSGAEAVMLPAPSEDRELLKAAALRQMRSWSSKGAKPPAKLRKRGILGWLADFWRDYDWVVYHIVIPLLALAAFYYHGAAIIENLPF